MNDGIHNRHQKNNKNQTIRGIHNSTYYVFQSQIASKMTAANFPTQRSIASLTLLR